MYEIEDAMLGGIEARDEGRPRHRALRRRGSREPRESALVAHAVKIRQLGPVTLDKARVHAVDADDDQLSVAVRGAPASSTANKM